MEKKFRTGFRFESEKCRTILELQKIKIEKVLIGVVVIYYFIKSKFFVFFDEKHVKRDSCD